MIHVRELRDGEEPILFSLFYNTIRTVNIRDYSQVQVEAWAPDDIDPGFWSDKMHSIHPFVIDVDGSIVGYSDLQPSGLIDHFFVHHEWQRRGVGRMLMQEIERRALKGGISMLETHASVTAQPFFEAFDFVVVREQELEMRGKMLKNYFMQRDTQRT